VVEFYIKADNGDAAIATAKQMWVDHGRKFIENDTDKTIPHYLGEGTSGFGVMQQWFDFDTCPDYNNIKVQLGEDEEVTE
jgi:hypothetical protein